MLAHNGRLKLAVQKEGRITEDSLRLIKAAGFDLEFQTRSLFSPCKNFPLDLLSIRDDDIPEYVQDGVSDLGIVGENIVIEKHASVKIIERLGFGFCKLVICAPNSGAIRSIAHLKGRRIATSYPHTVKRFLASNSITAEVIEISGSVEITPALDVADATCDIISTGSTARVHGLEVIHTVIESQAVLIANIASLKSSGKKLHIDRLLTRFKSSLDARGKRYVMMNAPVEAVSSIKRLIPGMKSPTIMPLADPAMVAVHSVVAEDVFWDVIEKLKKVGATDLVVLPIEKFIA
ncbi:MAG: ATP phosphoribosyltransferase [Bacteroidota bacterium]